jgi:hypothetical protein
LYVYLPVGLLYLVSPPHEPVVGDDGIDHEHDENQDQKNHQNGAHPKPPRRGEPI